MQSALQIVNSISMNDFDHSAEHAGIDCPDCSTTLDLHQPDPQTPGRMLATCCGCRAWYLLDRSAHRMLRLPDALGRRAHCRPA